jgi:hypothetical protein
MFRPIPAARISALTMEYEGSMSSALSACTTAVRIGKIAAHSTR